MGQSRRPNKVKLLVGLLSRDIEIFGKVKKMTENIFGRIDYESQILDFDHTDYYREEFGGNLKRLFLSYERLLDPAKIYNTKLMTNRIEGRLAISGRRTVNIDPGYLDLSKLVLLSTKDYSHRLYLDKGIYAEVTLFYKDGAYNPWPWTYPDYKSASYITIFNSIRRIYHNNLKGNH